MSSAFVVTGVAGFIGSHIAASLLRDGHQVLGIDNFDPFYDRTLKLENLERLTSPHFELHEADIRDIMAMKRLFDRLKPEGVFHMAALAGVRPSIADPARYASVNLDGLVAVLDAARHSGCRNIVFASSSSVYGNNAKIPFAESDPVDEPISPYAATKRAGELMCRTYSQLFGLSIVALRFFTVFGPSQRPDLAISKFMRQIARGMDVPMFGDGSTSRDYTYIDDIVNGVRAAYTRLAQGECGAFRIYNLGGSRPLALSEMIDTIGQVVGKTPRIVQQPMQQGDVQRTYADLQRSQCELGYTPTTPFVDGLQTQWRWLQSRLH